MTQNEFLSVYCGVVNRYTKHLNFNAVAACVGDSEKVPRESLKDEFGKKAEMLGRSSGNFRFDSTCTHCNPSKTSMKLCEKSS